MKKTIFLFFAIIFLVATKNNYAQDAIKTDKEIYTITIEKNDFFVTKTDIKTQKIFFKTETKITDKEKKEVYNSLANNTSFELVDDNIVIVYDIWQPVTSSKNCYLKLLNVKSGKIIDQQLLYSTKLNSKYSSQEIVYKPIYSPDKKKLAVLKDNISPTYEIDPELNIYDTKTFNILSAKKISGRYEGQKRIFDLTAISMDNNGDIASVLHLINEKTKITTKNYSADIPFNEHDLKNIKELAEDSNATSGDEQSTQGRFYKTLEDYINNKPIQGVRIKNGSFSWSVVSGTHFKIVDDAGNLKKEDSKNLPSEIFTYKSDNYSDPYLVRLIDKTPYIVLAAGKLNYYSLYLTQEHRYYSEGWDGKLKSFDTKDLERYLGKYDLLENFKKDKPKREFKDDVNGYFNKTIQWHIKYFNLLNEKM